MARTHSSHTASPTRFRSPQRSPARRPSQDGSQYEMDLDALGLNSTFESTELDGNHEPLVDRVDTSEIEGPDDFTMNMTYWMTADLPVAHIKSRKEAKAKRAEGRMDAMAAMHESLEEHVEPDEHHSHDKPTSPTRHAHGTAHARAYSTAASERSMENDEKVRSFLSALPDTDMEGALTGTPMHAPRHSFLQVPQSSPPKARSLQPTVEDYDTPRKPTQATVIHHQQTAARSNASEPDRESAEMAELQSRLQRQEQASQTRITELETILSYTRTELHGAQTENHRHTDALSSLRKSMQQQTAEHAAARFTAEARVKAQEDALAVRTQELGDEIRLQNLSKIQNLQADFEQQLTAMGDATRILAEKNELKDQALEKVQDQLVQLKLVNEKQLQHELDMLAITQDNQSREQGADSTENERRLSEQLSLVQARATELQSSLAKATAEARATREDAKRQETLRTAAEARFQTYTSRASSLEHLLQTARFELECAQADGAAKQQLFNANIDLNSRLRTLQSELETTRSSCASQSQEVVDTTDVEVRLASLQSQLDSARADLATRDQQILSYSNAQEQSEQRHNISQGHHEGLEANVATLRQQLAQAYRDAARAKTEAQQFERDLEDTRDRLHEVESEADRRVVDVEKRLVKTKEAKTEVEGRFKELQSQHYDTVEGHEAMIDIVRDKAEDAVRKAGALLEQERSEKRRVVKDLQKAREQIENLRTEAAQKLIEMESSDEETLKSSSPSDTTAKDTEILSMREFIRKQVADMKTLKSEMTALKTENSRLKSAAENTVDLQDTISTLEAQVAALHTENTTLQTSLEAQEADFSAVNKAMDEKLAAMLSKVMKERAKTVVGKRDGQWAETVGNVQSERELLGKVLLRQWGREEVGVVDEKRGEKQGYAYKYIQRS